MKAQIQKWGNSLAVRIPRLIAAEAHITQGTTVDLAQKGNTIIISVPEQEHGSLDALLQRVTVDNVHGETDTGGAAGRESW